MECEKCFPTSKGLNRHCVVHTRPKNCACSYCPLLFEKISHKMQHEKATHLIGCKKIVEKRSIIEESEKHTIAPTSPRYVRKNILQPHIAPSITSNSVPTNFNGMFLYTPYISILKLRLYYAITPL